MATLLHLCMGTFNHSGSRRQAAAHITISGSPSSHSSPHLLSNKPHCRHLCMGTFTLSSLSHCSSRNPSCGHHTTLVHGHFRKFWHKRLMIKRHKRLMIKTVSLMIQAKDTKCFRYFQYLSYLGGVVMCSLSLFIIHWPTST